MSASSARTLHAGRERYFAPEVPTRLAALRILIGLFGVVFFIVRADYLFDMSRLPAHRFDPVGPLWFLDEPPPQGVVRVAVVATVLCAVAFTLGWRHRVIGPLYAVLAVMVSTFDNSWQHIAHTQNLVTLHTVILGFAPSADAWSLDARRRARRGDASDAVALSHERYGWPVRLMSVLTVCTYALAGWAKLRYGGLEWIRGDVLRNQIAHDNVRKALLGDVHSPLGGWLVRFGWLFPPMAAVSVLVELGAPMALLRGRPRQAWVIGAWLFHFVVLALMAILFIYPLTAIAYASLGHPERWWTALRRGRWRRAR